MKKKYFLKFRWDLADDLNFLYLITFEEYTIYFLVSLVFIDQKYKQISIQGLYVLVVKLSGLSILWYLITSKVYRQAKSLFFSIFHSSKVH